MHDVENLIWAIDAGKDYFQAFKIICNEEETQQSIVEELSNSFPIDYVYLDSDSTSLIEVLKEYSDSSVVMIDGFENVEQLDKLLTQFNNELSSLNSYTFTLILWMNNDLHCEFTRFVPNWNHITLSF